MRGAHRAGLWIKVRTIFELWAVPSLFKIDHFQIGPPLIYGLREQSVKKKPQLSGRGPPILPGAQT